MRTVTLGFMIAMVAAPASAITLYFEDFSGQNGKGLTGTSSDLSGVDWTLSAPALSAGDSFQVVDERMTANDVNDISTWLSPVIPTLGFTNLSLSVDFFEEGDLEGADCACGINLDFLNLTALFDGGSTSQSFVNINGLGSTALGLGLTGDISIAGGGFDDNDFVATSFFATLPDAGSVQLQIDLRNTAQTEFLQFDNVMLAGDVAIVPLPFTGGLALGGLAVLAMVRRRKR